MTIAAVGRDYEPGSGVLVVYESSAAGRAALADADRVARSRDVPLCVLVVVPFAREDVGCGRCRSSAVLWNRELKVIAAEKLDEAARILGPAREASYERTRGSFREAVVDVATRERVSDIVIPSRPRGVLRRWHPDWLDRMRRAGSWSVRIAPASTDDHGAVGMGEPAVQHHCAGR